MIKSLITTLSRERKAKVFIWLSFLMACVIWIFIYPVYPSLILYWVSIAFTGLPALVFAEWIVNIGFGNRFVAAWPRALRIVFGVLWVLLCWGGVLLLIGLISSLVVPPPA